MDSLADTKWFYAVGTDRKGPFSREQISALLSAGVLNEHSKVWSESISEWTPLFRTELRTLLGTREISPPEIAVAEPEPAHSAVQSSEPLPAQVPVSVSYPVYQNRTLGTVLSSALFVLALMEFFAIGILLKLSGSDRKIEWLRFLESEQTSLIWAVMVIVVSVLFLAWKYRATANAFNKAGPQSITPWGAVYWYFVPVAFLWKPLEAMRNLQASLGGENGQMLYAWWVFWLGSFAVPLVDLAIYGSTTIDTTSDPSAYVGFTIASHATFGIALYCAARLVRTLAGSEAERVGAA